MNLESRLALLRHQAGASEASSAHAVPSAGAASPNGIALHDRLRGIDPRRLGAGAADRVTETALAERLGGEIIADGLVRIRWRKTLDQHHGGVSLNTIRRSVHPLLEEGIATHPGRIYLDTETTGLSGGSGTLVFLVGVAVVRDDCLEITQLLLTRYAGETALLTCLGDLLPNDCAVVTYNGKSFDVPLLVGRYRINRLADPFPGRAHLDLLHPVRRLFSSRWPDCRLPTAEQALLGLRHHNDLPGSAAPDAWFAYLRRGETDLLAKVCRHNAQDVLSLPALHTVLNDCLKAPSASTLDLTALARWLRGQDEPAALRLLRDARERLDERGLELLGDLLRRAGLDHEASEVWRTLAERGSAHAMEKLAKYEEHVRGDLQEALLYASRLPASDARDHRIRRIHGKLCRSSPGLDFDRHPVHDT